MRHYDNTLSPEQNGPHFEYDSFNFRESKYSIIFKVHITLVPMGQLTRSIVQTASSHYRNQCWPTLYGVTILKCDTLRYLSSAPQSVVNTIAHVTFSRVPNTIISSVKRTTEKLQQRKWRNINLVLSFSASLHFKRRKYSEYVYDIYFQGKSVPVCPMKHTFAQVMPMGFWRLNVHFLQGCPIGTGAILWFPVILNQSWRIWLKSAGTSTQ